MSHESFQHYYCDHCEKEVVVKGNKELLNWIIISRGEDNEFYGSGDYSLVLTHKGKSKAIGRNLHFCGPECMMLYLLKAIGESPEASETVSKKAAEKQVSKPTRFTDLDLVVEDKEPK